VTKSLCCKYNLEQTAAHRHVLRGSSSSIAISRIDRVVASSLMLVSLSVCLHEFAKLVARESARFDKKSGEPKLKLGY